jgi:hypothetical protein
METSIDTSNNVLLISINNIPTITTKLILTEEQEKALVAVSGIGHLDSKEHLINKRTYSA